MSHLTLFRPNHAVMIGEDIEALVLAISIRGSNVQYEVSWWNGSTRNTAWMSPEELRPMDNSKLQVGFLN